MSYGRLRGRIIAKTSTLSYPQFSNFSTP